MSFFTGERHRKIIHGESSSEPFAPKGLRMVEVYKHQIEDLETIMKISHKKQKLQVCYFYG